MPTVTGPELRKERRAADVTVKRIAARMGYARQTIHTLERSAELDAERVNEYRAALEAERAVIVASRDVV